MKLITGTLFAVLGFAIVIQLAVRIGFRFEALPGYVLGLALIGLCITRYWAYFGKRNAT